MQHQLAQFAPACLVQARTTPRARTVVPPRQALGVVTQHGIPQRLTLHARQPRRFAPRQSFQRPGDRHHARRCSPLTLAPAPATHFRGRYVRPDRQGPATHPVLPSQLGQDQNHAAPRRTKSRLSQQIRGLV